MKISPEAVRQLVAGAPKIDGRPTQSTLWALKTHLINALRKIAHPVYRHEGFAPYLRTVEEQALVQNDPWVEPKDPGVCFAPSQAAVTDQIIKIERAKYDANKTLRDNFEAITLVLTQVFEEIIDDAYHTGATGMGQRGFGNLAPDKILHQLFHLYGKPSLQEIESALKRLHSPMDQMAPIEVMLREIEEVQMFLLADRDEDRGLKQTQLIQFALIKLGATGMYGKALERW